MANKNKVLKQVNTVLLVRDMAAGGGNTTLAAPAAAGDVSVSLTSNLNFSAGDTIRLGSGSDLELAVISGAITGTGPYTANVAEPLLKPHLQLDPVVEQSAYDLGDITDTGVDVAITAAGTDVQVATKRLAFTRLNGYADLTAALALPTVTLEGIAFALGIPLASVVGNGSSWSNPKALITDGTEIASEQNVSLICIGVTMDGTPFRAELWAVDPDYTGFSIKLQRGTLGSVPAKFVAGGGGCISQNASSYVANTTYRPNKLKTFDALTEAGSFIAATAGTPLATTVTAPTTTENSAGQKVLNVTSSTNATVGTWVKLGTGSTVEFHRIASKAAGALTFDTNLYRTITTGVAVVEQALAPFATISTNGVTLAIQGTVDKINEATSRLSLGMKPGNAKVVTSMAFIDFMLATFARSAGIDPALIANNRLLLGNSIGLAQIDGIYVKGTLQDGTTAWFILWGCAQDVSNLSAKLNNTGVPELPATYLPSSGLQLLQHT